MSLVGQERNGTPEDMPSGRIIDALEQLEQLGMERAALNGLSATIYATPRTTSQERLIAGGLEMLATGLETKHEPIVNPAAKSPEAATPARRRPLHRTAARTAITYTPPVSPVIKPAARFREFALGREYKWHEWQEQIADTFSPFWTKEQIKSLDRLLNNGTDVEVEPARAGLRELLDTIEPFEPASNQQHLEILRGDQWRRLKSLIGYRLRPMEKPRTIEQTEATFKGEEKYQQLAGEMPTIFGTLVQAAVRKGFYVVPEDYVTPMPKAQQSVASNSSPSLPQVGVVKSEQEPTRSEITTLRGTIKKTVPASDHEVASVTPASPAENPKEVTAQASEPELTVVIEQPASEPVVMQKAAPERVSVSPVTEVKEAEKPQVQPAREAAIRSGIPAMPKDLPRDGARDAIDLAAKHGVPIKRVRQLIAGLERTSSNKSALLNVPPRKREHGRSKHYKGLLLEEIEMAIVEDQVKSE